MLTLPASRIEELVRDPFSLSREALGRFVRKAALSALKPSPKLNGREWVEKHGVHSIETSSRSGKFDLFPFQADMLELMTDPEWRKTALMKSARVGYTQIASFLLGYYTEHDPSKSAFILPTEADIGEFAKDSFNPMLRDIKALAKIRGGISMDDKLNRFFANGSVVYLRSAFSSDKLRRITAGNIFCDEVDADGWDSSGQGDKVDLAEMRTTTVPGSKFFAGSTPLLKGFSRIEGLYERGSQHRRFVPCPHCSRAANEDLFQEAGEDWWVFGELMVENGVVFEGHQVLEWGGGETFGIHYKTDPEDPTYICRHCQEHIPHDLKWWMDLHGEFRPTNFDDEGNAAFFAKHFMKQRPA
ncbi:phage terminase large subunit family protein [Roseovarius sp. S4756]|uniref:phage terminase large subunit family protein n=1 Tax=Roseovarius maritimus TaxID=3342637 RepID=UPI003729FBDD